MTFTALELAVDGIEAHPIDSAKAHLAEQPLLAADQVLAALGATRGHRSVLETQHALDVLARAVIAASSCAHADSDDPVRTMLVEGGCDRFGVLSAAATAGA